MRYEKKHLSILQLCIDKIITRKFARNDQTSEFNTGFSGYRIYVNLFSLIEFLHLINYF